MIKDRDTQLSRLKMLKQTKKILSIRASINQSYHQLLMYSVVNFSLQCHASLVHLYALALTAKAFNDQSLLS